MICVSEYEKSVILDILKKYVPDCEVRAFGSRYTWTNKDYSDLDVAVIGEAALEIELHGKLHNAFEESRLPFRVDVLDWHCISKEFRAIIKSGSEILYSPHRKKAFSHCQEIRLGDIIITNTTTYSEKDNWDYVNYLDTGNITENKIDSLQKIDLRYDKLPNRARRKIKQGDIIYSTVRPIQKYYGLIKELPENLLVSTDFTTISANSQSDSGFIYYYLMQSDVIAHLQTIAEQSVSTYPSIKTSLKIYD